MLVFGCKRYGQNTGNPACTYNELKFAQCTGKKVILLRMIPEEETFDHTTADVLFNKGNDLECFEWLPKDPMPPGLPEQIAMAMGLCLDKHEENVGSIHIEMEPKLRSNPLYFPQMCNIIMANRLIIMSRTQELQ